MTSRLQIGGREREREYREERRTATAAEAVAPRKREATMKALKGMK